jgi:hypothetical protein
MRIAVLLSTLMLTGVLTVLAQNPSSKSTASSGGSTLTGCVKGSKDQYYLVDKSGHRHTLMANQQDLAQYVNHKVTVTGKADSSRNAAASDAEGHRKGFFAVDNVSDEGDCKK